MISRTSNELPCFVILDDGFYWKVRIEMADGVRFELTQDCSWPVFKTGVFNRSTTHPQNEDKSEFATIFHNILVKLVIF